MTWYETICYLSVRCSCTKFYCKGGFYSYFIMSVLLFHLFIQFDIVLINFFTVIVTFSYLLTYLIQVTAGNAENVKDDLNGLDKAVSAVLGQRTIERNQLLVNIAKSKLTRQRDDKGEKVTKPEELVRLCDLLIQVHDYIW